MKSRILLLALLVLLTGCGLPFNRPAIGPDGTIALFLDEEGTYNLLPSGATLALVENGALTRLEGVTTAGDAGALAWSPDAKELVYLETASGYWGAPFSWTLWVTEANPSGEPTILLYSEEAIIDPAFTPEGDITYLRVDEEATGHLMRYSRATNTHIQLLEGVLSYRPARSGSTLTIIRGGDEGALRTAHVATYDPNTERIDEIASFFLGGEMEETLLLFPACFLWDIDSSGRWLALALRMVRFLPTSAQSRKTQTLPFSSIWKHGAPVPSAKARGRRPCSGSIVRRWGSPLRARMKPTAS